MESTKENVYQDSEYVKISTSTKGVVSWDFKMLTTDVKKIKAKQEELEAAFPRYPVLSKKEED